MVCVGLPISIITPILRIYVRHSFWSALLPVAYVTDNKYGGALWAAAVESVGREALKRDFWTFII